MKVLNVIWFSARSCVGLVQCQTEYEGVKYYIGCPPGEDKGFNEEEDIQWIADWGAKFPQEAGDLLFGVKND